MNKLNLWISKAIISDGKRGLKLALVTAFLMAIVTSIPQIHLWYVRGSEWNGSCAYSDWDELAYVAYTNALIDGRPRQNDPYSGKDSGEFESLFSIQFLPAYTVAIPAKLLHIPGDIAFILLLPIATIATVLAIWWLLFELTGNSLLAAAGAICVVSFGTAAAHSPLQMLAGVQTQYNPFPFLRRHIPAVPFPIFFLANVFIWRALTRRLAWVIGAAICFSILVYSYFFLWTALAGWFFTILILWFLLRPADRSKVLKMSAILAATGTIALTPYFWLLTQRGHSMDREQLLELSHAPDLFRAPELYAALILCFLIYHLRLKWKRYEDPTILFTASFALAPFLLFNQQLLTGRSLQPFHYEEFAANYWVVVAAVLAIALLPRNVPRRIFAYMVIAGLSVALMLATLLVLVMERSNIRFDQLRPVARKLSQEKIDGVVFASDGFLTQTIPTASHHPVLWARYLYTFSNVDSSEQKRRFYQYLYYSGFNESLFAQMLQNDVTAQWEIFGPKRVNPMLSGGHSPITPEEIESATTEYRQFMESFESALGTTPLLRYAVVSPSDNLSNLDRWYERIASQKVGDFIIYSLKSKVQTNVESLSARQLQSGFALSHQHTFEKKSTSSSNNQATAEGR
jgi:hypothetical protein